MFTFVVNVQFPCEHVPSATKHCCDVLQVTPLHRSIPMHWPEKHYEWKICAKFISNNGADKSRWRTRVERQAYAMPWPHELTHRIVICSRQSVVAWGGVGLGRIRAETILVRTLPSNMALIDRQAQHTSTQVDTYMVVQTRRSHHSIQHKASRCKEHVSQQWWARAESLPAQTPFVQ